MYEVEKIVEHRELGPERFLYLVKWKGFDDTQCTWEPLENLTGCIEVVYQYKLKHMSKLASPVNQRYHKLKTYLSQHTDELLDIFVQRFRNDRGELCIPEVDVQEVIHCMSWKTGGWWICSKQAPVEQWSSKNKNQIHMDHCNSFK